MTTINVNYIEGRKGSACRNDSLAVTVKSDDGKESLLDILCADNLGGRGVDDVRAAYTAAVKSVNAAYVEGRRGSACVNGGWHVSRVTRDDNNIPNVTLLDFVSAAKGRGAVDQKVSDARKTYARELLAATPVLQPA